MEKERTQLSKAYRRAGLGLGAAALLWTSAFLFAKDAEVETRTWIIPIASAALSVFCFSLARKIKD